MNSIVMYLGVIDNECMLLKKLIIMDNIAAKYTGRFASNLPTVFPEDSALDVVRDPRMQSF